MTEIVFWQSMITPHQAGLVRALAARTGLQVSYVAAETVERSRAAMGWQEPGLGDARLHLAQTPAEIAGIAGSFGPDAVHLCQGFRGNGVIARALPALTGKGARVGVMMEAVDQRGPTGWLKKPLYRRQIKRYGEQVEFCLAIGAEAGRFVAECGFRADRIFPFSYFLSPPDVTAASPHRGRRVVYVGKLVELKRVDLLIEAFGSLNLPDTCLTIVGAGPLEQKLRALGAAQPNAHAINWRGTLENAQVQQLIADSDCLVLPSEYDGWGAVVTEALLAGTPAICSSACGAAVAVDQSGTGGVFASKDPVSLAQRLRSCLTGTDWSSAHRSALGTWASNALSASAGAGYLEAIIGSLEQKTAHPPAPWLSSHQFEKPQKLRLS